VIRITISLDSEFSHIIDLQLHCSTLSANLSAVLVAIGATNAEITSYGRSQRAIAPSMASPPNQLLQLLASASRSPVVQSAVRVAVGAALGAVWRAGELATSDVRALRILHAKPLLHGGSVYADAFQVRQSNELGGGGGQGGSRPCLPLARSCV